MATTFNNGESGASVRDKINTAIEELNTATSNISALQTTVSSHTSSISTINSTLTTLSSTVSGHTSDISSLNTALIAQASQISTINSTLTSLSSTVSGHTTSIASLTSSLATKQDKDSISTLVTRINEIATNFNNPKEFRSNFYYFNGTSGSGVTLLIDVISGGTQTPVGKSFSGFNAPTSIDDIVITADTGVTIEYAGSLASDVLPGEYFELLHWKANQWIRIK